ncbi:hypothetical protein AGMMS50239_41030 [Bacteroidia bacterium]|nr:hypothetical protein AGMMS50239_41030 [Bacteroidia bacterium]
MESNNKTVEFSVISSDDILIKEIIESYNEIYNTDFEIIEFIYDEVVFAKPRVSKYTLRDIFSLGYQFGSYAENKRQKGEIDW